MYFTKEDGMNIGVIGRGFVGDALYKSFLKREQKIISYDKYKNIGKFSDILDSDILFLCLPTPSSCNGSFNLSALTDTLTLLRDNYYNGLAVVKSTVEPGTTRAFCKKYKLNIVHNPEFLTARSNYQDFDSQDHIVLGKVEDSVLFDKLVSLYVDLYKDAKISICSSEESEAMKLFCNCFYAAKVQIFNELYFVCKKMNIDFENVKKMMFLNNWINPKHTDVPGPDGMLSYGGACFPKDTEALNFLMKKLKSPNKILESVILERDLMREK